MARRQNAKRLARALSGAGKEPVQIGPRPPQISYHEAIIIGVDAARSTANIQLDNETSLTGYQVQLAAGYTPAAGEKVRLRMEGPKPFIEGPANIPGQFIKVP